MKRHALLTIAFAALFGVRAPLCALACLDAAPDAPIALVAAPDAAQPPCHGEPPAPAGTPDPAEHACDCDRAQLVVSKGDAKQANANEPEASPTPTLAMASPRLPSAGSPAPGILRQAVRRPPPDILLLNSTLLL